MREKVLTLNKCVNSSISEGDKVILIDGSALYPMSEEHKDKRVFIVNSYPEITGSELKLHKIKCNVLETGLSDKVSYSGNNWAYLLDIVILCGNEKFRTCSEFVKIVENE